MCEFCGSLGTVLLVHEKKVIIWPEDHVLKAVELICLC